MAHLGGCDCTGEQLPTWRIEIEPAHAQDEAIDVQRLAAELLDGEPGVAARTEGQRLVVDLRSVMPWQDIELVAAFEAMDADEKGEE